jgi:hypothetical protein
MKNKYWNISNTILSTWFERDRAHVSLESDSGDLIFELWDNEVLEFIEDGFKKSKEHWHDSLVKYANERGLNSRPGSAK